MWFEILSCTISMTIKNNKNAFFTNDAFCIFCRRSTIKNTVQIAKMKHLQSYRVLELVVTTNYWLVTHVHFSTLTHKWLNKKTIPFNLPNYQHPIPELRTRDKGIVCNSETPRTFEWLNFPPRASTERYLTPETWHRPICDDRTL